MGKLIKKIKIKKQDGTFTDYIPIGAEAKNIETDDGDSVQLKLNKKPYYYNTIADMKADTKLKIGDMAVTLGYHEANDGGAGEYKIIDDNYTDDGGRYHLLNNDLIAELVLKDKIINVKQYGAYGDDIHDDSMAFQKCISKYDSIFAPRGIYSITTTLDFTDYPKHFKCEGQLHYIGNDYCIRIQKGQYDNIYVRSINSTTGGALLIQPTGINAHHTINLGYCSVYKEVIKVLSNKIEDTSYNFTNTHFYGKRWYTSGGGYVVDFEIQENHTSYFTEHTFHDMRIAHASGGTDQGIHFYNLGTGYADIQVCFTHVNLEGSGGFYTDGRISKLDINYCRTQELYQNDNVWLKFRKKLPNITLIGNARLYLTNIEFEDITASDNGIIVTTYEVQDQQGYVSHGGVISYKTFYPYQSTTRYEAISSTATEVTLYNWEDNHPHCMRHSFLINNDQNVLIHMPFEAMYRNDVFYFTIKNDITVTLQYDSNPVEQYILQGSGNYIVKTTFLSPRFQGHIKLDTSNT